MSAAAELKSMHPAGTTPRPGSHCSDGMHVDTGWHFHDMHQLLYAFEGAIEVESARGRHLIPRQLAAWIPAGVPHRTSIHRVRSGSVFFPPAMVGNPGDRVRTVLASGLMRAMIRESMRWPFRQSATDQSATDVSTAFFAAMSNLCSEWITRETELLLPRSQDARVTRALEFTRRRPDVTLAAVCKHAGMSERSLRRHFKADVGLAWEDYRRRARLLDAIALLSDTDVAIGDIAMRCGFESPSAFAKAFRLAIGEAPRDYRNRVRDPVDLDLAHANS